MAQPRDKVLNMPQGASCTGDPGPFNAIRDEEQPDSSAPLFNMYRKMAEEEDNKIAERWQKDADGILIFTGLFSAAVAALAAVTVMDLKPNSQDTSAFYLENIYQLLADPNVSRSSIPVAPVRPPPFSPPKYVIWVNSLWFLSLTISLTCAMLATLLQQWARRYLRTTQRPRYSPHDGARIRAFFAHGVGKLRFCWAVDAIPTLIHVSLFLFFAGLLIYLFNINYTVFRVVVWWVAASVAAYLLITVMPILRLDGPYRAPLSSIAFRVSAGVLCTVFFILSQFVCLSHMASKFFDLRTHYLNRFLQGIEKTAENVVRESSQEIDGLVLKGTFDALAGDHELDRFIESIYGFYSSNRKVVQDPQRSLARLGAKKFSWALVAFLNRTWSSGLVSESDKIRRLVMCVGVVDATRLHVPAWWILLQIFTQDLHVVLQSVEMGHSLRGQGSRDDQEISLCTQSVVAGIIANVQGNNDRWIALTAGQLGESEDVIRGYLAHCNDSVLLANLTHITRQIFCTFGINQDMASVAWYILPSLSRFNIRNALPGLQHGFCALWNTIVVEAQLHSQVSVTPILRHLRHLYIDLHQDTDAAPTAFSSSTHTFDNILKQPLSYPLCDIPSHHPYIDEVAVHAAGKTAHGATTTFPTISLHDVMPTAQSPVPSSAHTSAHPHDASSLSHVSDAPPPITIPVSHSLLVTSQHIAGASAAARHESFATPPSMKPDSLSSAALMPVPGCAPAGDLHSPADSVNKLDRPFHGPASSSSSQTTTRSRIAPRIASFSGPGAAATIAIPEVHGDIQGPNAPSQLGSPRYPRQSDQSASNVVATALGRENGDPSGNLA